MLLSAVPDINKKEKSNVKDIAASFIMFFLTTATLPPLFINLTVPNAIIYAKAITDVSALCAKPKNTVFDNAIAKNTNIYSDRFSLFDFAILVIS